MRERRCQNEGIGNVCWVPVVLNATTCIMRPFIFDAVGNELVVNEALLLLVLHYHDNQDLPPDIKQHADLSVMEPV